MGSNPAVAFVDYLTLVAIVKDEERHLAEWVRYHRKVGVEKFVIWDNDSRVPVAIALKDVMDSSITIMLAHGSGAQQGVYTATLAQLVGKSEWALFLDADEVIVPQKTDDVRVMLADYMEHGGLCVNWRMFGSSGHLTPPPSQIRGFTKRAVDSLSENRHVKSFVRPKYAIGAVSPHSFSVRERLCVGEDGRLVSGPFRTQSYRIAQVNHYYLRSRAEWAEKCVRGAGDGTVKRSMEFDLFDPVMNDVVDLRAVELLDAL